MSYLLPVPVWFTLIWFESLKIRRWVPQKDTASKYDWTEAVCLCTMQPVDLATAWSTSFENWGRKRRKRKISEFWGIGETTQGNSLSPNFAHRNHRNTILRKDGRFRDQPFNIFTQCLHLEFYKILQPKQSWFVETLAFWPLKFDSLIWSCWGAMQGMLAGWHFVSVPLTLHLQVVEVRFDPCSPNKTQVSSFQQ